MPEKTPFHERTSALCTSMRYKDWAGYYAVCSYGTCHEPEYYAFRHACGLLDVTPLFKYEVTGPDACALLTRVMTRDVSKLRKNRVAYTCWCDAKGKLVDDGTVTCLGKQHYRVTAAEPSLVWFERHARGLDVTVEESTRRFGALALQGPTSRGLLSEVVDFDLAKLRFFRAKPARLGGHPVTVTRTGYTGDLGYEVWVEREHALDVWDAIVGVGHRWGLRPAGLDALDMVRVEAGFVLAGVDYFTSRHCIIDERKSSPLELGLDWTVHLERAPFVGQKALVRENAEGPKWRFVGLELDWDELEALYEHHNLPPSVPATAWRTPTPVYDSRGRWIGYGSSGTWSPILKKNLAMAHIRAPHGDLGDELQMEVTVEFRRHKVTATVVDRPFFDPPRKRG